MAKEKKKIKRKGIKVYSVKVNFADGTQKTTVLFHTGKKLAAAKAAGFAIKQVKGTEVERMKPVAGKEVISYWATPNLNDHSAVTHKA